MTDEPMIQVRFDGWADLTVDEVWPDGDAPDEITAEAVAEKMRADGHKMRVLGEWCLTEAIEVHTSVGIGAEVEVWP